MKILKMVGYVMSYVAVAVIAILVVAITKGYGTYTKTGYINSIYNNKISVIDEDGEEWEFYGDDFEQGQKVVITFHNNGTNHTEDDRIIGVEIS